MGSSLRSTRRSTTVPPPGVAGTTPSTTTSAADMRPRASPPAASPAASVASSRWASGPEEAVKASAIAGHTSGERIMLACTAKPSPSWCPAWSMHSSPVVAATEPSAATAPTWRSAAIGSAATAASSAVAAGPALGHRVQAARPVRGLRDGLARHRADTRRAPSGTTEPTANMHVCTATPSWPVAASRATIE